MRSLLQSITSSQFRFAFISSYKQTSWFFNTSSFADTFEQQITQILDDYCLKYGWGNDDAKCQTYWLKSSECSLNHSLLLDIYWAYDFHQSDNKCSIRFEIYQFEIAERNSRVHEYVCNVILNIDKLRFEEIVWLCLNVAHVWEIWRERFRCTLILAWFFDFDSINE